MNSAAVSWWVEDGSGAFSVEAAAAGGSVLGGDGLIPKAAEGRWVPFLSLIERPVKEKA